MAAHVLNNFGYIIRQVPNHVRETLTNEISRVESGALVSPGMQGRLVGHIRKEYRVQESLQVLEPFLLDSIKEFDTAFDFLKTLDWLTASVPFSMDDVWINFQSKHEYNPPHHHGGILSYVIWVRIPFDLRAEMAEFPELSPEANQAACFNFLYADSLGRTKAHTVHTTKDYEWKMIMFPASMTHYVNPFRTTDLKRVSIAGNIRLYTG